MHISSIELRNFKRFTDLTIDLSKLDQPPKLVLLIGANGSGKSSVFDAFDVSSNFEKTHLGEVSNQYYAKDQDSSYQIKIKTTNGGHAEVVSTVDDPVGYLKSTSKIGGNNFYGRSSLRQTPRLARTSLGASRSFDLANDSDRPLTYVDRDERFENDLEEITRSILQEFYQSDRERSEIIKTYIDPINQAFERIFDEDKAVVPELVSIVPPLDGKVAEVRFKKGNVEFRYDLLSSGEKSIFNILINLLSRKKHFQDTIYFIDELDLHLNTRLQYNLLKEITEHWIPENCQLWTASHSYGFIDYAREADHAAIVDFDSLDFDVTQVLLPEPKDSLDVFDVAVPKESIFKLFDKKQIILCENQNDEFYNLLALSDKLFVGVRDKNQVFLSTKQDSRYWGLMDRDFLTEDEIKKAKKKYPQLHVLAYYCFENYLYHPDNIAEVEISFDKQAYLDEINRQKKAKEMEIIAEVKTVRNSYAILKEDDIRDRNVGAIVEAFSSNEFESYYTYFDMKSKFSKASIASYNLTKERLANTPWFKQKIEEVLA